MINLEDFKIVKNGKSKYTFKTYRCTCNKCGADRGYKRKRASSTLCRRCSNAIKYEYDNVDFSDYKSHETKSFRLYRTSCIKCGKDKGYHRQCYATKACHSCAMKLKWEKGDMSNVQKGAKHSYPYMNKQKEVILRSSYELAYAKWLDSRGINWEYEPHFKLSNGSNYFPDFKLEDGTIVEIKGYFREDAKIKWQMFKEEYPNLKKSLLMKKELRELGVL